MMSDSDDNRDENCVGVLLGDLEQFKSHSSSRSSGGASGSSESSRTGKRRLLAQHAVITDNISLSLSRRGNWFSVILHV
jgi:hypothetical protein